MQPNSTSDAAITGGGAQHKRRRRAPSSKTEQERRKQWGTLWGALNAAHAQQLRKEQPR